MRKILQQIKLSCSEKGVEREGGGGGRKVERKKGRSRGITNAFGCSPRTDIAY